VVRKSASPSKSLEPRRLVLDGGIPEEESDNSGPAFKKLRKNFPPSGTPGTTFRIEVDWPTEARCFYPMLGAANASSYRACAAFIKLATALFIVDGTCVMTMTAKEFETIPLRFRLRQG